jgi:hypothetical protein
MSAEFTADVLRRLASYLDGLTQVSLKDEVWVSGYTGDYIDVDDHKIRIHWDADVKQYVVTWPDDT